MNTVLPFLAQAAPASGTETEGAKLLKLGEISVSHDGLIRAAIVVGVIFLLSLVLKRVFAALAARSTRGDSLASAMFIAIARGTHLLVFALTVRAFVPAAKSEKPSAFDLSFGDWTPAADKTATVLIVVACTMAVYHLARVPVVWFKAFADRTESKLDDMLVPVFDTALKVFVILGGILQLIATLSNSTPTQILAPLAVGGLAIGLAAQDTVKNFFGSTMLILDKPFTLGDTVNIGSHTGTVESLGLRSTRIRTPDGHVVSVPNGDLANRAIQNVSMRRHIRQVITIGVTYDTPVAKLDEALALLNELLVEHEGFDPAFPPRVHFEKMADWSLNIQVIYWYHPGNYWAFMAFNQRLQLDILRRFERAGISIAFPTQTVIHQGGAPFSVPATPLNPPGK